MRMAADQGRGVSGKRFLHNFARMHRCPIDRAAE
jgi:hypothetical protein